MQTLAVPNSPILTIYLVCVVLDLITAVACEWSVCSPLKRFEPLTFISVLEPEVGVSLAKRCTQLDRSSAVIRDVSRERSSVHAVTVASNIDVISVLG